MILQGTLNHFIMFHEMNRIGPFGRVSKHSIQTLLCILYMCLVVTADSVTEYFVANECSACVVCDFHSTAAALLDDTVTD